MSHELAVFVSSMEILPPVICNTGYPTLSYVESLTLYICKCQNCVVVGISTAPDVEGDLYSLYGDSDYLYVNGRGLIWLSIRMKKT